MSFWDVPTVHTCIVHTSSLYKTPPVAAVINYDRIVCVIFVLQSLVGMFFAHFKFPRFD